MSSKNVDVAQKVSTINSLIANLVAQQFPTGQSFSIQTPSVTMNLEKVVASNLSSIITLSNAKITLPSFCDLMMNSQETTTTTTKSPYLNIQADANNCTNRVITLKVILEYSNYVNY